jgi:hypothetical protein
MEVKLASLPFRNATDNAEGLQAKSIYCLTHTKIYYLSSWLNFEKGGNSSGSLPCRIQYNIGNGLWDTR